MQRSLTCFVFVLFALWGSAASARERLGVFIVVESDTKLSDDLTEVAIAKLAERGDYELVGSRELREPLRPLLNGESLARCLSRAECVIEVARAAQVQELLVGHVASGDSGFELTLSLLEAQSAAQARSTSRHLGQSSADLQALIVGVQSEVASLFEARDGPAPTSTPAAGRVPNSPLTPEPAPPVRPEPAPGATPGADRHSPPTPIAAPREELAGAGSTTAATRVDLVHASSDPNGARPADRSGSSWRPRIAWGAAALAVTSLSVAAVAGSIAQGTPTGSNRAEAQRDLARRQSYASVANGLYAAAGVLGATSVVNFVWKW